MEKGYVQKQGIYYEEVFASVARIETVSVVRSLKLRIETSDQTNNDQTQ